MMLQAILSFFARCCGGAPGSSRDADVVVRVITEGRSAANKGGGGGDKPCVPAVFAKKYGKVVPGDVDAREAVCITQDVAVLGDASVAGDSCITGSLLIAGSVVARGSICVTGAFVCR